jgi:RND family efflux transporter MFP subunit
MTVPGRKFVVKRPFASAATAALAALLTVAAAWLWAHEGHQPLPTRGVSVDAERGLVTLGPEAAGALGVQVAEARAGGLEEQLAAQATVVAPWQRRAFASTRLGGTVTALHVRPGQEVKRGQVVAEVEGPELLDLQRELLDARAEERLSGSALKRLEGAAREGVVPEKTLRQIRTQHRQNVNALEIARRKLLGLGVPGQAVDRLLRGPAKSKSTRPLRALPVVSPLAGVVVHVDVAVGQVVEPMEHLLEVVDLSRVWVSVRILEKDLARVAVGQLVSFRLPVPSAAPSGEWACTISVKERYLAPDGHGGTAWAELDNPGGRLLPGMVGQARVTTYAGRNGLLLPASALVAAGAERFVFVEEGPGQYRRKNVVVVRARGGEAQVAGDTGLYPGDRVVTAGSHELASLFVQGVLRLSPEAERNVGLRVEPARKQRVAEVVTLSAVVELPPSGKAVVSSRLAGVLHRIAVDRDQAVRAGEVVAEVASPELHNLQLELLRSHLQLRLQEETLQSLRDGGDAVPERMIPEAVAAVALTRQRRDGLRNKLLGAGLSEEQVRGLLERRKLVAGLPVRAPISGVVVRFRAALGQAIKAEAPLFEVHDLSRAVLRAHVPERELHRVRVGQRGRVHLTAAPRFVGEAVLARAGRVVAAGGRAAPFWADLKAPAPTQLLPGMLARLTVALSEPEPTLAVPRGAVLEEGAQRYLFVRRPDGSFERRPVETGRADDQAVEITRGLAEGEPVAVAGVTGLQAAHAALQ